MSKIKQAFVAPSISFFKKNFLEIYGLTEYNNINEPAIFFGASESSHLINNHKSYKIVLPCRPNDVPLINNYEKTFIICSDNYNLPGNVIRKSLTPKIKNYDIFKPNILGNKIYFYSGFENGNNLYHNWIAELQKRINYEIITTNHKVLSDYYSIDSLKSNYYDKCFLNINLTNGSGLSTVIEMGLMGRKTIFKNPFNQNFQRMEFPNFLSYETIDDIVKIINIESNKIGTIQPSIDAHNIGDEWIDLNFWL